MQTEIDSYEPVTTFTRRVQCNQIASYCIVTALLIVFLVAVQPNFVDSSNRIVVTVLFMTAFCVLVVSSTITSKIDPVDPVLVEYRAGNRQLQGLQVENCYYCDTCHSVVKSSSRHCKKCDRCVDKFDHHCVWINNCVGESNYSCFFVMIVSALGLNVMYCVGVAVLWQEHRWNDYLAGMVVAWILFPVAIVVALLLGALVGFHIFLMAKKTTTFEFIISLREKERVQGKEQAANVNLNNTQQTMGNNNHNLKGKVEVNDIIFSNEMDEVSGGSVPKVDDSTKGEVPSKPKNPSPISSHDEEVKQFFERHKSLKLLVGNSIAVRPFNESQDKKYRSNVIIQGLIARDKFSLPKPSLPLYRSTVSPHLNYISSDKR